LLPANAWQMAERCGVSRKPAARNAPSMLAAEVSSVDASEPDLFAMISLIPNVRIIDRFLDRAYRTLSPPPQALPPPPPQALPPKQELFLI